METASYDRLTPKEVITRVPFIVQPEQNGQPPKREALFKNYGRLALAIASTEGTRYYVAPASPHPVALETRKNYQQELRRVSELQRHAARKCLSMISAALKPAALGSTRSLPKALLNEITLVATERIPPHARDERERFKSLLMESIDYVKKVRAEARLKEKLPAYMDFHATGDWLREEYIAPNMFPLCNHGILQRMAENIAATYWGAERPSIHVQLGQPEHLTSFMNVLKEVIIQVYIAKKSPAPTVDLLESMVAQAQEQGKFSAVVAHEIGSQPLTKAYARLFRSNTWYRVLLSEPVPKLVKEERLSTPSLEFAAQPALVLS